MGFEEYVNNRGVLVKRLNEVIINWYSFANVWELCGELHWWIIYVGIFNNAWPASRLLD